MIEFAPGGIPPGAKPHEVMMAYGGVRETAPNRGPWPDETLRFVHLEPDPKKNPRVPPGGYPWCCAAGVWCCDRGGVWLPRTGSVVELQRLIPHRRIAVPELGCIILHIDPGGQHGHFLFWLGWNTNGTMRTVSANTNENGSRNGYGVFPVSHEAHYATDNGGGFYHARPLPRDPVA